MARTADYIDWSRLTSELPDYLPGIFGEEEPLSSLRDYAPVSAHGFSDAGILMSDMPWEDFLRARKRTEPPSTKNENL